MEKPKQLGGSGDDGDTVQPIELSFGRSDSVNFVIPIRLVGGFIFPNFLVRLQDR